MSWKLTMNDITEYKAAFSLFDKDKSGKISIEDCKSLIRSLGQIFSDQKLNEILEGFRKKNGVELYEFLDLMAKNRILNRDKNYLLSAFKYFDKDNSGKINFEEFSHALSTLQECLTKEEIKNLEKYCTINNGYFDYAELLNEIIDKK